jgi:hypothetical protein
MNPSSLAVVNLPAAHLWDGCAAGQNSLMSLTEGECEMKVKSNVKAGPTDPPIIITGG